MNSIIKAMPKYDHRQHALSDWLAELDQRFQLGEVDEDTNKITWCQLLIGATESGLLSSLGKAATWEEAKEALLTRLGIGSVRDEAWAALKGLKKGTKDIMELAGEAEKLAKSPKGRGGCQTACCGRLLRSLRQRPGNGGAEIGPLDDGGSRRCRPTNREDPGRAKMERLVSSMQDQIRILKKDLKEVNEQIATHKAAAPTAAAMAAIPAPTSTVAAAAQTPLTAPARHIYHDYGEEMNFHCPPRRQLDRRPPRCFPCGEEGHFLPNCPVRPVLQCLLRQQARASARAPPRGHIMELPATEDDSHTGSNVQLNC